MRVRVRGVRRAACARVLVICFFWHDGVIDRDDDDDDDGGLFLGYWCIDGVLGVGAAAHSLLRQVAAFNAWPDERQTKIKGELMYSIHPFGVVS